VLKNNMKKLTGPLKERLFIALQAARHTPNDQGVTPAELMHGWKAVTQFDRIRPRSADMENLKDPLFSETVNISCIESTAGEIILTGRQVQLLARMALKFTLLLMSRDTWWVHAAVSHRRRMQLARLTRSLRLSSPNRRRMRLAQPTRRRRAAAGCGWPGTLSEFGLSGPTQH